MRSSRFLTCILLFAPMAGASLVDVVRRKRTNKTVKLYAVEENIGAAPQNDSEEEIDDRSLNELWNEATELDFIDERFLNYGRSNSMSFPHRGNLPSSDETRYESEDGYYPSEDKPTHSPPSEDKPTHSPPSEDKPTPSPPSEDRPTPKPDPPEPTNPPEPSEPTNPPEPTEPTTPPEPTEPTTPPAPTNPGECLEGTTREDYLFDLLSEVTDPALLEDPDTPQGQALEFMVADDFDPCTYPTIEQRYGLTVLYYATEGDDWLEKEGWVEIGVPECEWLNVTCVEVEEEAEIVVAIHLSENGLDGVLPEEISTLNATESLIFFNNSLREGIPDSISSMTDLKLLDVESNDLTGEFFSESILSLSQLQALRVSFNELNGTIPNEIDRLSLLEEFWLAVNQFKDTIPTTIGNLNSLDTLFLYNNTFNGAIPSELGTLTNLTQLRLQSNVLAGNVPEEIYNLVNLSVLRLDRNFLDGTLSTNIGNLVALEDFRLDNQFPPGFTGNIPEEMVQCSLLRNLLLNDNGFTGPLSNIFAQNTVLEFLDVSNNDLSNEIPEGIFLVDTLQVAYFTNNTFTGPIPPTFTTPPDLKDLYFDGNELSGTIPAIPANTLQNLEELLFERNNLTGEMPESICALRVNTTGEAKLAALGSDCSGDPPEVICDFPDCCNRCFS